MTFPNFGPDSPFYSGFEKDPQGQKANYFGRLVGQNLSPNRKKWFEGQFEEVQNRYLGQLGQQVLGGQSPTLSLSDYLTDYFAPSGTGMQDWRSMSPQSRGEQTTRFAPPTRWNF